jgi:tetratricopeptide (TPR) repeat protein
LLISICLIVIAVLISFYPSLKNGFVNWDDGNYVKENELVKDLSVENIKHIFSSFYLFNYHPLTILSYAFDYRLFKLDPSGYHLTNLILHLLNCIFVFWLIFLISRNISVSFLTSILFGVHPLHVESVAWISGRKDVLFAFFYLSALIAYIYYLRPVNKAKYYVLSLLFFILSILSKAAAITLPPLLFLVDYITNRKYGRAAIIDKIPFAVLSFVFGIIAFLSQSSAIRHDVPLDVLAKLKVASYSIIFYLWKLILPLKLSCFYPYPRISNAFAPGVYNLSLICATILFLIVWYSLRHTKKILFGALFFLLSIFLNLQFVPLGAVITADRYTYIPAIGIFFIAGLVFTWLVGKVAHNTILKVFLICTVIMTVFSFARLTRDRCEVWENGFTLWNDAIGKYGSEYIPIAYFNRGVVYLDYRKEELASSDLKKALELYYDRAGIKKDIYQKYPGSEDNYAQLFNYLGVQFAEINLSDEAIILFKKMIERFPSDPQAYLNLCAAYGNSGKYKDAIFSGNQAVKLSPESKEGYYFLAVAYYFDKQYELAKVNLQTAVRLGMDVPQNFLDEIGDRSAENLSSENQGRSVP